MTAPSRCPASIQKPRCEVEPPRAPSCGAASTTVTESPWRARIAPATRPARPAPAIATSHPSGFERSSPDGTGGSYSGKQTGRRERVFREDGRHVPSRAFPLGNALSEVAEFVSLSGSPGRRGRMARGLLIGGAINFCDSHPERSPMRSRLLVVLIASLGFGFAVPAFATGIDCSQGGCTVQLQVTSNGTTTTGSGSFTIDPKTGGITLTAPISVTDPADPLTHAYVTDVHGNADPILGFAVAAGTGLSGATFAFSASLPIALSGTINANSSISYSLTGTTAAGAQIAPTVGTHVLTAQEVDTTPGGLDPLNKGVDAGNKFFFTTGPQTQNSPVFTASNSFVGNLAYDLMSATLAFSLSPSSQVGISGFA